MTIGDPRGTRLILSARREAPPSDEVWVSADVRVDQFSVSMASCIARSDWDRFLDALTSLEASRRGEAALASADGEELQLRIYAKGPTGHMALDLHLSRRDVACEPRFQCSRLSLEPDRLPALLQELWEAVRVRPHEG